MLRLTGVTVNHLYLYGTTWRVGIKKHFGYLSNKKRVGTQLRVHVVLLNHMAGISKRPRIGRYEAPCSHLHTHTCTAAGPQGPLGPDARSRVPASPVVPRSFCLHGNLLSSALICLWGSLATAIWGSHVPQNPTFWDASAPHCSCRCCAHPLVTSLSPPGGSTAQWSVAHWREWPSFHLSETGPWALASHRNGPKTQICHLLVWGKLLYLFKYQFTQI